MRFRWLLISILSVFIVALGWQVRTIFDWWRQPSVNPSIAVYVDVKSGSSLKYVAQQLADAGVINHPNYFIFVIRVRDASHAVQAGEYLFAPSLSPEKIYLQLKHGKVMQHAVTLVEGWTFNQFMIDLTNQPLLKHDLQGLTPQQIMQKLGLSQFSPEGWFYPDTYFYARGMSEQTLLLKAYKTMQTQLNQAWAGREQGLPYQTPYEALIAASIIEKESAVPAERHLVASVVVNRLRRGMPLQMDPTIIYGLGPSFNGNITTKDLRLDTPYNTYLHKGLPPTPIAMPGMSSIDAALHPASTPYLYFVANGNGTHQFSESLAQHDKAVKAYLKTLKKL